MPPGAAARQGTTSATAETALPVQQLAASVGVARITPVTTELGSSEVAARGGPAALVCADRSLRGQARAAGFVPAAHAAMLPLLATADDAGRGPFRRAARRARAVRRAHSGVVPMHFQPIESTDELGADRRDHTAGARRRRDRRLSVVPLACDPAVDDLVWVRVDDGLEERPARGLVSRRILFAEPGQVLVALGPDESSEAVGRARSARAHRVAAPRPGPAAAGADRDLHRHVGRGLSTHRRRSWRRWWSTRRSATVDRGHPPSEFDRHAQATPSASTATPALPPSTPPVRSAPATSPTPTTGGPRRSCWSTCGRWAIAPGATSSSTTG